MICEHCNTKNSEDAIICKCCKRPLRKKAADYNQDKQLRSDLIYYDDVRVPQKVYNPGEQSNTSNDNFKKAYEDEMKQKKLESNFEGIPRPSYVHGNVINNINNQSYNIVNTVEEKIFVQNYNAEDEEREKAKQKKKRNINILLFVFGTITSIIIAFLVILPVIDTYKKVNDGLAGDWKCDTSDKITSKSEKYSTDIRFYVDGKIKISKFGDGTNNYIKGEFITNKINGDDRHYNITVTVDEYMKDGESVESKVDEYHYDSTLTKVDNKDLLTMRDNISNVTYYCYKKY